MLPASTWQTKTLSNPHSQGGIERRRAGLGLLGLFNKALKRTPGRLLGREGCVSIAMVRHSGYA